MSYFKDCNLPRAYIENSTRKTSLRASSSCSNFEKENIPTYDSKNKQYRIPQKSNQIAGFEGRGVLGDMENRPACFGENNQIQERKNTKYSNSSNQDNCGSYQLSREEVHMQSKQQSSQQQYSRQQSSEESFTSSISSISSQRKKQVSDLSAENDILQNKLSEIMPLLQRFMKNKQDDQNERDQQQQQQQIQIQIQRESQRFSLIDNAKSQRTTQRVPQDEFQDKSIQEKEKQVNKLIQKQRSSSGIGIIGSYSNELQSKGQIVSGKPPQKMKKEFEECMVLVESSRQKIHELKSCLVMKEEEIRKLQDTVKDYANITERLLNEIEVIKENMNQQNQTLHEKNRFYEEKNKQIKEQNEEMVKQTDQLNRQIATIMQQNEEMRRNVELQHQKELESLKGKVKKLQNHVQECKTIWFEVLTKANDKNNSRINIMNEQLLSRVTELFGGEVVVFLQAIQVKKKFLQQRNILTKDEKDHKRLFGELEERLVGLEQSLSNNYIPQTKIQLRSLRKYIALTQGIVQPEDLLTTELIGLNELNPLDGISVQQQLQKQRYPHNTSNGKQSTEVESSQQQMMINNNVYAAKNSEGLFQNSLSKMDGLVQNEDLLQMILIQANILQSAFGVQ